MMVCKNHNLCFKIPKYIVKYLVYTSGFHLLGNRKFQAGSLVFFFSKGSKQGLSILRQSGAKLKIVVKPEIKGESPNCIYSLVSLPEIT